MVEVYVHHRDMEGIHLRGGKIAEVVFDGLTEQTLEEKYWTW